MIKSYLELEELKARSGGLTVAFGCFDILHYGHLNFINRVLKVAKYPFAVGVLPDEYVRATKGEARPLNGARARLEVLSAACPEVLAFEVSEKGDYSFYQKKFCLTGKEALWEYPINTLYKLKPTEFYYSTDFPITKEILAVFEELGIKHAALPYTEGVSSTELIKKLKEQNN